MCCEGKALRSFEVLAYAFADYLETLHAEEKAPGLDHTLSELHITCKDSRTAVRHFKGLVHDMASLSRPTLVRISIDVCPQAEG
jgi:hypothetical protein